MDQKKTGAFLQSLRKERELTQEELAEKFSVTSRTVSRWETGKNMPDISLLTEVETLSGADFHTGLAADDNNFVVKTHAKFSYGRVLEAKGDFAGAAAAYTELNDSFSDDSWANLAKSRLIALKKDGKIE